MNTGSKKLLIALSVAVLVVLSSVIAGVFTATSYAEATAWSALDMAPDEEPPEAWDGEESQPEEPEIPEEPGEPEEPSGPEEPEEPGQPEEPGDPDEEEEPPEELQFGCGHDSCEEDCADDRDCVDCTFCPDAEALPDVADPTYIELENGWTGVSTGQELAQAIRQDKTMIRLLDNIDMPDRVNVFHDTVIDGAKQDGPGNWTINEVSSGRTLRLSAVGLTVTVRNVDLLGVDYYGFVTQRDTTSSGRDATVIYENVHYTGPQLAWLSDNGTLVVKNSTINLEKTGPASNDAEELGEAAQFIFEGRVVINREQGSVWLMRFYTATAAGQAKPGLLEVRDNATLIINQKTSYLLKRGAGINRLDFKIGNNATVELTTALGWCENIDNYIDEFSVGEHSTVTLRRTSTAYSNALSLYESLKVGRGSTLMVEDTQPIVYLRSQDVSIQLDDPALVRIDRYFNGSTPGEMRMTGKAFNYWTTSDPAGEPDGILGGPQGQPVTINYNGGVATASYVDRDGETVSLSAAGFLFSNPAAKRYVMGSYDLALNDLTTGSKEITGSMSDDGSLRVSYFPWDADVANPAGRVTAPALPDAQHDDPPRVGFALRPASAGANGAFAPVEEIWFDLARAIQPTGSITGVTGLYAREAHIPRDDGTLMLTAAPELLDFGVQAIPGQSTYFPLAADVDLVVTDSRAAPEVAQWSLRAKSTPLYEKGTNTVLLEDAVGVMRDGLFQGFAGGAVVWSGARDLQEEQQNMTFHAGDRQNGLVVRIDPFHARVARYEATITWTLSVGI